MIRRFHRIRIANRLRPHSSRRLTVVLLGMALATFLSPVTYRAGAEHGHAHTIVQGVVDSISGQPHSHGSGDGPNDAGRLSHTPFSSAAIPLSILIAMGGSPGAAALSEPDAPRFLGLSMPISSFSAIEALGTLIASLLAGGTVRPIWADTRRLLDRTFSVEPPPPRSS